MSGPLIHGDRRPFSASAVLKALGDDLSLIRQQDELTWDDVGRVMGKSGDQAAKYADGTTEMGAVAYHAAKREWGGRFTGTADCLVGARGAEGGCDRDRESRILQAALALSIALADGELQDDEIRANRATLERARCAIDGLLGRIAPLRVVAE